MVPPGGTRKFDTWMPRPDTVEPTESAVLALTGVAAADGVEPNEITTIAPATRIAIRCTSLSSRIRPLPQAASMFALYADY
jgi:hypothetical protein